VLFRLFLPPVILAAAACQGRAPSPPVPRPVIEAKDSRGTVTARVTPGHPCRANVDGLELLVGGRPLVAMNGSARWTGEDAADGTTLRKNDEMVARIHANQLFDHQGLSLVRLMADGSVQDFEGKISRRANVAPNRITIGEFEVTGTHDAALAVMLTAPEATPEVRALAACHYLLVERSDEPKRR
jgi:hypothetical protein